MTAPWRDFRTRPSEELYTCLKDMVSSQCATIAVWGQNIWISVRHVCSSHECMTKQGSRRARSSETYHLMFIDCLLWHPSDLWLSLFFARGTNVSNGLHVIIIAISNLRLIINLYAHSIYTAFNPRLFPYRFRNLYLRRFARFMGLD